MKQLAFEALKIQRVNFITPKLGAPCINLGQISCDGESSAALFEYLYIVQGIASYKNI